MFFRFIIKSIRNTPTLTDVLVLLLSGALLTGLCYSLNLAIGLLVAFYAEEVGYAIYLGIRAFRSLPLPRLRACVKEWKRLNWPLRGLLYSLVLGVAIVFTSNAINSPVLVTVILGMTAVVAILFFTFTGIAIAYSDMRYRRMQNGRY